MCFFDQILFDCGDWKWDRFREHCNREYRTGETCGMKLVLDVHQNGERCKTCQKIDTKRRRKDEQIIKLRRWQREGGKLVASIEKALQIVDDLNREIAQLEAQRIVKQRAIGNASRQ